MIYTIIASVICLIIGFQAGVRGTRSYYEDYLDSLEEERQQSEEDFLSYAAPDDAAMRETLRRLKKEKHER